MKTIRRNVFETNSSSCHSVTVFPPNVWRDFKAGKLMAISTRWDIVEHEDILSRVDEDWFMPVEDVYKLLLKCLESNGLKDDVVLKKKGSYGVAISRYIKNNITFENFIRWMSATWENPEVVMKLEKPLSTQWGGEYDSFNTRDLRDFIGDITFTRPDDDEYTTAFGELQTFDTWMYACSPEIAEQRPEKPLNVPVPEEGQTIETNELIIRREHDELFITEKNIGNVTVTRDVEC